MAVKLTGKPAEVDLANLPGRDLRYLTAVETAALEARAKLSLEARLVTAAPVPERE